ncbi:uncharacterized protein AB675_7585 [Cyphellophora attinorum]|uniref:Uncharacterized protein n=1 Tax=Cyphellophora attinorum TaxID=1664694 RepID=A0A0N0NMP1_9EURO|nr:uncharacterized protein AB675_7585 [Phialophora attinorum]KPI40578.1 hypothetical protein AB675_7585 [Phialophora attinorum]
MLTQLPAELRVKIYAVATEDYILRTWTRISTPRDIHTGKVEWPWKDVEGLRARFFFEFLSRQDEALKAPRMQVHAGLLRANKPIREEFISHLSAGGVSFGILNDSGHNDLDRFSTLASLVLDPWRSLLTTIRDLSRQLPGPPYYPALRQRHGFPALKCIEKSATTYSYRGEIAISTQSTRPAFGKLLEDLAAGSRRFCTTRLNVWVRSYEGRASDRGAQKEPSNVKWVLRHKIGHLKVSLRRTGNNRTMPPYRALHLDHIANAMTSRNADGSTEHILKPIPWAEKRIDASLEKALSGYTPVSFELYI